MQAQGQIRVKSIRQRRDGRHEVRTDDGRSYYGRSVGEALAKVPATPEQAVTLAAFLPDWFAMLDVRPSTLQGYRSIARHHFTPLLKVRLDAFTPLLIQRWVHGLTGSPRSVQQRHAVLRRCLQDAVRLGLLSHNPARGVTIPRQVRYQANPLSQEQAQAVLAATAGTRWYALYVLAIACGLRRGELLGLRWSDIASRTLRVSNTVLRIKGELVQSPPKSASSVRTMSLPVIAVRALEGHRHFSRGALVFHTSAGKPHEPSSVNKHWDKLRRQLRIDARFHDLRHTCATLLLNAGVEPAVIQATLGHSTIAITLNIYAHVLPPMQAQAATVADALFPDHLVPTTSPVPSSS